MRRSRLLVCLTAGLTAAAAALSITSGSAATPNGGASSALPWLHVEHPAGELAQVTDSSGRTVILRGVNIVGLEDDFYRLPDGTAAGPEPFWSIKPSDYAGKCPANSLVSGQAPVCESDFAQMRALGFNVVRLPVSWSLLEPTPGKYDATYVARVAQVVGWAKAQGIYTLIDMHEDSYSRFTPEPDGPNIPGGVITPSRNGRNHADGAPPWAVMASGAPPLTLLGTAELDLYVESAFTSFWLNRTPTDPNGKALPQGDAPGPGLQDHFTGALRALVARFTNEPAVVGYEIMNEPLPGLTAVPGVFDQLLLYPFYGRVIAAMTEKLDKRHLFFVEPSVERNLTDVAVGLSAPFTPYPNIVYAPHVYTHVFTAGTLAPAPVGPVVDGVYPLGYDQAMITATAEAKLLKAALFIGEYGNSNSDDATKLAPQTAAFDKAGIGSVLWQWKGNCSEGQTSAQCNPGIWSMFYGSVAKVPAHDAGLIPSRVKYVARAYPRHVAGTLESFAYSPETRRFTLSATYSGKAVTKAADATVVFIPKAATGAIKAGGAAKVLRTDRTADGNRIAYLAPTGAGSYTVTVG